MGKGTGPSNLPDTAVGIFLSRLKKWAQKSPEVVETSGLFALISFLVQLDGGQYRTRTCDPMHVKHVLIPAELTVRIYKASIVYIKSGRLVKLNIY